ncbi:MAG: 1-deoxy-D-xylulose-5-phosphate synthase N-terminal domain-containing protein [bacterium]
MVDDSSVATPADPPLLAQQAMLAAKTSHLTEQAEPEPASLATLTNIQRRVLWLSTLIVHHANNVRTNPSGMKVGGHQASSASVASIMTMLFFDFLRAGDRLAVKPHAAPVLHAIHYLLGTLDKQYLTTLRAYHGLQAYPSRTKDPFPVDFSTGSVGLGAVAPNFAALVERYTRARFGTAKRPDRRFIALIGDAELDEGSVWEAVAEPALAHLDNILWIVDLNRQSLDRVIPGIRVRQLEEMFRANSWDVFEAKYGCRLKAAFSAPGGERLKRHIDEMPNEEYQFLLRSDAAAIRRAFGEACLNDRSDDEVKSLLADLGGHDLDVLRAVFAKADAARRPAVIFAYTIKGWGLPIAGDPLNHSALLSEEQMEDLRLRLGIPVHDPWAGFAETSAEAKLCVKRQRLLAPVSNRSRQRLEVPDDLGRDYGDSNSTQRAFGQILTTLRRIAPEVGRRIVTVSPDVATSTNLGGWINQVGVWSPQKAPDPFTALGPRLIKWERTPSGQHLELGISETNLLMALGQLGLSAESDGEPLVPIGTLYDPFVARALDAFVYSLYSGSKFVLVGTPSGITLSSEGGAHQSVITPSIGISLPGIVYYEPCFALELEWILLESLRALHREENPLSAYLRLSTVPIDQRLLAAQDRDKLHAKVLSGAYRLVDRTTEPGCIPGRNLVEIWATGVMVPEAVRASDELLRDGYYANVINCVSPDLIYRTWQDGVHRSLATLQPEPITRPVDAPIVTVLDGHPSALAWVGSMLGQRVWPLGVTRFGESGTPSDLYKACGIDWESIYTACYVALQAR